MAIVFFCQSCGARFDVPDASAGKKGRCRKCGQLTEIPKRENLASMMALPVLEPVAVGAGAPARSVPAPPRPAPRPEPGIEARSLTWLKAAATNVGLMPVSADHMPALRRRAARPDPLDDLGDSKPYAFAAPAPKARSGGGSGRPNEAAILWRRGMGGIQGVFRRINEFAYFISVPFIIVTLLGIVLKSRSTALFGATFVVILNVARIVSGVANLAAVPLRDGLNANKMKKPFHRIVEPVVTIGLVVLAFTFIPWLASDRASKGTIAERLKSSAKGLAGEMKGEARSTLEKAENLDLNRLGAEAREKLKTLGTGEGGPAAAPGGPQTEKAVGDLIKGVGERARKTISESLDNR